MFIVFEGLDGSGKSTQAKKLHEYLQSVGKKSLLTCEPTHGTLGSLARMVTKGEAAMEDETLALVFAADRHEHYISEIAPFLQEGGYVVCDRYYHSNLAYQGVCEKSFERVLGYNRVAMENPPDIVFFLMTEPKECLERLVASRPDASIYENEKSLEILSQRYMRVLDFVKRRENIRIVETSGKSESEVFWECLAWVL